MNLYNAAQEVVEWNKAAGKVGDTYTEAQWDKQAELCQEELNELLGAVSTDPNMEKEFIAEACDLFVVVSFYHFMRYGRSYQHKPETANIVDLVNEIDDFITVGAYAECIDLVCDLLWNLEGSDKILRAKLDSNWSKLPKLSEFLPTIGMDDIETAVKKECERIENQEGKRYTGVHAEVFSGSDTRLVFKEEGGKVVKPITYKGWKEFL